MISLIESLPSGVSVCHGDPNPNNIIVSQGEYKLIDWVNSGVGNPMYDIAEYIWMYTPKEETNFEGVSQALIDFYLDKKDLIIPAFINAYEKLSGQELPSCEPYILPLLVRKLHSNRTEEEKSDIVIEIRDRLSKL